MPKKSFGRRLVGNNAFPDIFAGAAAWTIVQNGRSLWYEAIAFGHVEGKFVDILNHAVLAPYAHRLDS